MTDHELEQRLRTWYRVEVADEVAPASLYANLSEITETRSASTLRRRAWLLLAAALLLGAAVTAVGSGLIRLPQVPDLDRPVWLPAGTTIEPREGHTATALPNGIVLVVGGSTFDVDPRLTELFDPNSRSWSRTGNLSGAHGGTTATLLADGRALLAGVGRAEVYDPQTGTWTATGAMTEERYGHKATLLTDGRVLVTGGVLVPADTSEGTVLRSAELFNPGTGTWEVTGPMDDARHGHTATLLPNGMVLVAGGLSDNPPDGTAQRLPSAELYDPATGTWTDTGPMHRRRGVHTATMLPNGLVLIAGGNQEEYGPLGTGLASAELYDPALGAWTETGQMAEGRVWHAATALDDGTVLVTGGATYRGPEGLASTERYDAASGQWIAGPPMAHTRLDHTATLLPDGSVLIVGGVRDAPMREVPLPDGGSTSELAPGGEVDIRAAELYRP
jgi:hypothetical protein